MTGHCNEFDYKEGTGFLCVDVDMGRLPCPLEYVLRDATGPEGGYHENVRHATPVIVDHSLITGRSAPDRT